MYTNNVALWKANIGVLIYDLLNESKQIDWTLIFVSFKGNVQPCQFYYYIFRRLHYTGCSK